VIGVIRFKQVSKVYETDSKQVTAVDQINLDVDKGHICVFLGPSGCGKTTLLRMVNRLISITDGTIELGGKNIASSTVTDLRRHIGYVIQQVGLFPNMTIEENIGVVPKLLGWERVKMKNRYNELMDLMGLNPDEYCKRYPWELSGGQQQRIGVARALAADPPVMLMDEPFGALDPIIREHIQNEFLRIQSNVKKTILFVSHDIDEAIKLGDTVAIFKAGKLMQHGTPDEILSRPNSEFVRDFIGEDRSLKRLSLLTVKDLLMKHKPLKQPLADRQDLQEYVVSFKTNLRTALSIVLSSPNGQVLVVDDQSASMGLLSLKDFDILGELHPQAFIS
jgi:osmoprotectant transport system ATP-binding protein